MEQCIQGAVKASLVRIYYKYINLQLNQLLILVNVVHRIGFILAHVSCVV